MRPENLNCRSKNVVYLISCKTCRKQYTGSSEEFRARFNNYRNFADSVHSGKGDWEVRLIDQSHTTEDLRKKESFWQLELDNFQPNGLNEIEVFLFCQ